MDLPQFWRYNLYTACTSRWLAGRDGVNADLVFTVGLMHGIGQLHMHAVMPEAMVPLDSKRSVLDPGRAELEQQTLGFHYGDVAAELAKIWHFPEPIIAALRDVPMPLAAKEFSEPAAWVHMGAWRARTEVLSMSDAQVLASYPTDVAKRLHLAPGWVPAQVDEAAGEGVMPALKELTEGLEAMLG